MSDLKFKTFGELDVSEALTEASHVIIEENGDVKRFPTDSIGKVKTINGVEPDESGNVLVETSSVGASSWEDLGSVYTNMEPIVILEEGEVTFSSYTPLSKIIYKNLTELGVVVNGLGTLTVTYDSVEYTANPIGIVRSNSAYGNSELLSKQFNNTIENQTDTDLPFAVTFDPSSILIVIEGNVLTHTVGITYNGITETVTQVPEKYIPEAVIAPCEFTHDLEYNSFTVHGYSDVYDYSTLMNACYQAFEKGGKIYGSVYLTDAYDYASFNILDAIVSSYSIEGFAIKINEHKFPYYICITSKGVTIYNSDGTTFFTNVVT